MRKSTTVLPLLVLTGLLPGCRFFMSPAAAGRRSSYIETFRHDKEGHTRLVGEPTGADLQETPVSPPEDADSPVEDDGSAR